MGMRPEKLEKSFKTPKAVCRSVAAMSWPDQVVEDEIIMARNIVSSS
jgi:hypothetical protein